MHYTRTSLTIDEIIELYHDDLLELNPSWQRDPVWEQKKKPALIQSIMNEIPIPEITLWNRPDDVKVAVDGQQRLRALIEFNGGEYKANDSKYEDLTEEEADVFDKATLTILLLGPENTEDQVINYYKLRNSSSTAMSTGELIRADTKKPVVSHTIEVFKARESKLESIFGKKPVRRDANLANTVPYLASRMHGIAYLSKSYKSISGVISSVKQNDVDAVKVDFEEKIDKLITVCQKILADPANTRLKSKWQGFPPLRKVSPIWCTILNPDLLRGRELVEFWTTFYKTVHLVPAHEMSWENSTRKNASEKQLKNEIEWAHKVSVKPA